MYKLVIQDDEGKTTVVPLVRDEITIGRKEGNTIRLTERNVSRRHARIVRSNGSITIEDLNSYNGVKINGSRIQGRCEVKETDRVQIGDYQLELKVDIADKPSELATQPMPRVDALRDGTATPVHRPASAEQPTVPMPVPAAAAAAAEDARMPRSTVEAEGAVTQAAPVVRPQQHGRLVILSSNFAGREFALDKPACVIGRTDENDIVINHRSISRHHAKVVREHGRYSIVDLHSSNGVRVNGEEYGKVELRRGDTIDLGHVRMRFVEPGEDFVFGRDAHAVDIAVRGSRRGVVLAMLLLAAGGLLAAFLMNRGRSSAGSRTRPTPAPQPGPPALTPVPPAEPGAPGPGTTGEAPDPPPADPPPAEGSGPQQTAVVDEELAKHLERARTAMAADQWANAQAAAKQALEVDPSSAEAAAFEEQARRELANQLLYERFLAALRKSDHATVARTFARLDRDSVYRIKGQPEHDRMRQQYLASLEQRLRKLATQGRCREHKSAITGAAEIWPEASTLASTVPCTASGTSPAPPRPPAPVETGGGEEEPVVVEDPSVPGTAEELIEEARTAAKASQFGKALRLCELSLAKKRGFQDAYIVCAIAACNLKNEVKAQRHIERIKSVSYRSQARQICLRNGVKVE
jgi:pSer/pThr/pTyr-binding forkhead associated (FHA) protein